MSSAKTTMKATVFAVALFGSSIAAAEAWADYRTITHLYPHDGGVSFILDGAQIAPSPCPNRFLIELGAPNYNVKISALLSAHAQGKRIQINYNEAQSGCDIPVNRFITEN